MKFLRASVILGFFAIVAEAVSPDRKSPTQGRSGPEASINYEAATRTAAAALSGLPTSRPSLSTLTVDRGEVPAHIPKKWQDLQMGGDIMMIKMDEHPVLLLLEGRTRRCGAGTYGLNGGVAVIVVSPQHIFLVHNSMEKWQGNGISEFGASLPPPQNTVAYFVRPSTETLNRWERMGRQIFSEKAYLDLCDNVERVLISHGLRHRINSVGYGTTHASVRFSQGTVLVQINRRRGDVVPSIQVEDITLPGSLPSSPIPATAPQAAPIQGIPPLRHPAFPMHAPPHLMDAFHPSMYAASPPMHAPLVPVRHEQWAYSQWAPSYPQWQNPQTRPPSQGRSSQPQHPSRASSSQSEYFTPGQHPQTWQPYQGQFPQSQHPAGESPPQPGYFVPGYHPKWQPPR